MIVDLKGKVAVVTGATRGCGRGIAVELGAAGATVYVTGRTTRETASPMGRKETIEETAELVSSAGGHGIPVRCDYTVLSDVDALRARISSDHGALDILVDDIWGGDLFVEFGTPFWESDLDKALGVVRNGLETHLIALHRLVPLVVGKPGGLVIEVTDGDVDDYPGPVGIPYHLVKSGVRAIGRAVADDLAAKGCTGLSVTPGYLRSEMMMEHYGVTEETWESTTVPDYRMSETPRFLGRGVVALASDPDVKRFSGKTLASWTLMREYGFTDVDGSKPDWGRWFKDVHGGGLDPASVDPAPYR
ncbi:3-oxoacyl-[acyl-carrier protein] reductase [Alloactinosynnema sp. L-07]|uniref:SDR family oxidoreductase n=1 Tax=Alloactinosynnema sp. L-07 TaxID=1653480 RepID=UPI00065EFA3D|nr:SDR family oxidoreductase [Alloactinosynnema sp. L-07]CRK60620.1 3-oxoacyl-[acyl-carrier protein] reductase [Alloactinosynnema sp. L-07]